MRRFVMLAALCTLPNALYAQAATAPATEKPAKEKKICRQEDMTGSIMRARVCHTKEEWVQIDAENARNARRILGRDSSTGNTATH